MWATVVLLATLETAPLPVYELKLTNERVTHNELGWERKDSKNPKLLPGDIFILLFDIEGLTATETGQVKYSIGMEVQDKNGKLAFRKDPEDLDLTPTLGSKRLPASARTLIPIDQPPSTLTMKVTITDRGGKKPESQTLTRTFEVIPIELGLVRLIVDYNTNAERPTQAPSIAVPGQNYVVNFAAVGFTLDEKKKQPNIAVEMRILDDQDKPVLDQPFRGGATEVGEPFKKIIPMQFILNLNRPGKFRIQLKITDNLTKKTAEESLSFQVLEAK